MGMGAMLANFSFFAFVDACVVLAGRRVLARVVRRAFRALLTFLRISSV